MIFRQTASTATYCVEKEGGGRRGGVLLREGGLKKNRGEWSEKVSWIESESLACTLHYCLLYRESIDKLVPKEESHGSHHSPGMVPQGSFLSMPYMMHNQVPSSTTLEFRDHDGRILPLLDPSLSFADGRKLKHGAVAGIFFLFIDFKELE